MKHSKKLKEAFVILFAFLLSNCAKVEIKDSEWCGDLGEEGASCFNTISDRGRDIAKEEWDQERIGMLCSKSQTFADWQAVIIKLCRATRRCTFQDKQVLINFMDNVKTIEIKTTP